MKYSINSKLQYNIRMHSKHGTYISEKKHLTGTAENQYLWTNKQNVGYFPMPLVVL